jgi:hypothetical protein
MEDEVKMLMIVVMLNEPTLMGVKIKILHVMISFVPIHDIRHLHLSQRDHRSRITSHP